MIFKVGRASVSRFRAIRACVEEAGVVGSHITGRVGAVSVSDPRLMLLKNGVIGIVHKEPRKEVTGTIHVTFDSERGVTKEAIDEPLRKPEVITHDENVFNALKVSSFDMFTFALHSHRTHPFHFNDHP